MHGFRKGLRAVQNKNWWINNIGKAKEGTSFKLAALLIAAWWIDNVACMT
jgi:hypothetical protein